MAFAFFAVQRITWGGDLCRQGREIGRVWTSDPEGYRPNLPFTWGAQPHKGFIYFNDIN
jgi:hypothetical protein